MKVQPHVPTGAPSLDKLLTKSCPGFPRGCMSEIVGEAGSGKTTLLLATAAEVTRLLGTTFYIDAAAQLSPSFPGVEKAFQEGRFALYNTSQLSDVERIIGTAITNGVDLVVVDPFSQLLGVERPEAELTFAHQVSGFVRRITTNLSGSNTAVVFATARRLRTASGAPLPPLGGKGFAFAMYRRLLLERAGQDEDGVDEIRVTSKKDSCAATHGKSTTFKIQRGLVLRRSSRAKKGAAALTRFDREDPI